MPDYQGIYYLHEIFDFFHERLLPWQEEGRASLEEQMPPWESGPTRHNTMMFVSPINLPHLDNPSSTRNLRAVSTTWLTSSPTKGGAPEKSAAVALLAATNKTLVEEIIDLNANNKYLGGLACSATTTQPGEGNGKGRWTKANSGCFIVGGYCRTHGFCVGKYHDSGPCSTLGY